MLTIASGFATAEGHSPPAEPLDTPHHAVPALAARLEAVIGDTEPRSESGPAGPLTVPSLSGGELPAPPAPVPPEQTDLNSPMPVEMVHQESNDADSCASPSLPEPTAECDASATEHPAMPKWPAPETGIVATDHEVPAERIEEEHPETPPVKNVESFDVIPAPPAAERIEEGHPETPQARDVESFDIIPSPPAAERVEEGHSETPPARDVDSFDNIAAPSVSDRPVAAPVDIAPATEAPAEPERQQEVVAAADREAGPPAPESPSPAPAAAEERLVSFSPADKGDVQEAAEPMVLPMVPAEPVLPMTPPEEPGPVVLPLEPPSRPEEPTPVAAETLEEPAREAMILGLPQELSRSGSPESLALTEEAVEEAPHDYHGEEIESILADFRAWLEEASLEPEPPPAPVMDLATVVQQFTALRQDVNLQTKASRAALEQNAQVTDLVRQAQEAIKQQQAQKQDFDAGAQDELVRPLLKALIDAHDALSLARREVQRKLEQMPDAGEESDVIEVPEPPEPPTAPLPALSAIPAAPAPPPAVQVQLPFWARWLGLGASIEQQLASVNAWHASMRAWQEAARVWHEASPAWHEAMREWHKAAEAWHAEATSWHEELSAEPPGPEDPLAPFRQILETLLVGYQMSQQRIERILRSHGLETIPCTGLPFDPELMEVVEVVRQPGRSDTVVLEEVRPGYMRKGRLFRYAQVRVAK